MTTTSPSNPPAPEPISWRSWAILLMLAGAGIMFLVDRNTMAILKTTISTDFGFNNADYSLLITAYMFPYVICYLFSGQIVDRIGTRMAGAGFLVIMSIATFGCAIAQTKWHFVGARALLGIGESGVSPATIVMLTLWFPASRRAFAMTTCQSIQVLGPILAPPVVATLALHYNWHAAFIIPAILSISVAVIWFFSDRNRPYDQPAASPKVAREKGVFLRVLKAPRLRGLILARIICDPFYFFLINWQTGFLQEQAGWSLKEIGKWTWLPYVFVMIANVLIGIWSDRQGRKGGVVPARARTLGLLAMLGPCAIVAPFVSHNAFLVLAMLTFCYFMANCWVQISGVMVSELAPPGTVATAIGILSFLSGLASIGFNQIAGTMVDHFGYTIMFVIGGCLHPLAAFILWFCYLRPGPHNHGPLPAAVA